MEPALGDPRFTVGRELPTAPTGRAAGEPSASQSGHGKIEAEGIPEASTLLAQLYESKAQENPEEMDLRLRTLKDTFDLFDKYPASPTSRFICSCLSLFCTLSSPSNIPSLMFCDPH